VAPYRPNSLDGGCPFRAGDGDGAFIDVPVPVEASVKERGNPQSFADHFSQASLFYRSLSPAEKDHVVDAYAFELSKCWDQVVRERQLQALANIHADLCRRVADRLGMPAPQPSQPLPSGSTSAALSQSGGTWPVAGRQVGIVVGPDVEADAVATLRAALHTAGVVPLVVGPHGGDISGISVQRSYAVAASIELDAVIVAGPVPPAPDARASVDTKAGAPGRTADPRVVKLLGEAWRHAKAIGALDGGDTALAAAGVPGDGIGVVRGDARSVAAAVLVLLAAHRSWQRFPPVSAG
jgi:catalase